MQSFLLAFIPIFVAIDPIGTVPFFLGLTQGFTPGGKKRLSFQAVCTAFVVSLAFGVMGRYVFSLLGISPADFKIAGGLLLLIFSIREIYGNSSKIADGGTPDDLIGIVPIGVPLVAGPALITTLLILTDIYPFLTVVLALSANLLITFVLFAYSDLIIQKTGEAFGRVVAKVVAIFLAAIGIMMIRKGLETFFLK